MTTIRTTLLALALLAGLPATALAQAETNAPHAGPTPQSQQQEQTAPPGLYQIPGQQNVTRPEDVPLFVPAQDQLVGRVSIPDSKLATLVQPEGRTWREFRTFWLRWGAAAVILGMAALLTIFYLVKGKIRIERGRSGRTVTRFSGPERFAHWTLSGSFLILAVTGLVVTFGRPLLIPLIGHPAFTALSEGTKVVHNFTAVPFVIGLLMVLVFWIRDNIPEKADIAWVKSGGGIIKKQDYHPETGRFNAGQKILYWGVIFGGLALTISGAMMMVPFGITGISGMQIAHVVHAALSALMIAAILGHIYIGTIGMEGAFDAMGSGEVDENWAMEHHYGWYKEMFAQRREPGMRGVPAE